jgi:SpoIID/LytB domain protein
MDIYKNKKANAMKRFLCLFLCSVVVFCSFSATALAGTTDSSSEYSIGDVNSDGKIQAGDARLVLRHVAMLETLTDEALKNADMDADGKVTAADARKILRIVAKIDVPYIPDTGDDEYEGTFEFDVYGWGHGVGMSQYGAVAMAKKGSTYDEILKHYYTGIKIKTEDPPETMQVKENGETKNIDTKIMLQRIVLQEIGGVKDVGIEALKAQAVAAYTYIKYKADNSKEKEVYKVSGLAYSKEGREIPKDVKEAVDDVYGEYMTHNSKTIDAVFFAISAGKTADPKYIWGSSIEYLKPVDSPDKEVVEENQYNTTVRISSADMKKYLEAYIKSLQADSKNKGRYDDRVLPEDPAEWLTIVKHDSAVDEAVGYVMELHINTLPEKIIIKGNTLRETVLKNEKGMLLRSPCFNFQYIPK